MFVGAFIVLVSHLTVLLCRLNSGSSLWTALKIEWRISESFSKTFQNSLMRETTHEMYYLETEICKKDHIYRIQPDENTPSSIFFKKMIIMPHGTYQDQGIKQYINILNKNRSERQRSPKSPIKNKETRNHLLRTVRGKNMFDSHKGSITQSVKNSETRANKI